MPHEAHGDSWDEITIGGLRFSGVASVSGDSFKKKIDKRKAAGADGARIVDKGFDLVEFTITLTGWLPEHAQEMESLASIVAPRGGRESRHAIDVDHPSLLFAGIVQMYVTGATLPVPQDGKLVWTIRATEFRDPPRRNTTRRATPAPQGNIASDIDPEIATVYRNNPIPAPSASGAANP